MVLLLKFPPILKNDRGIPVDASKVKTKQWIGAMAIHLIDSSRTV